MNVLIPLPKKDFDPTEVAIPWSILSPGCEIIFTTPDGARSVPDHRMVSGEGLGFLAKLLRANSDARSALSKLLNSEEFENPLTYEEASEREFDAILLPGGHAEGMREYLESEIIRGICERHMKEDKPMAAICHGTLVLARASKNGHSLLYGRKITALPKSSELMAWNLTKNKLGDYYRTYPDTTVEDEVVSHLKSKNDLIPGPPLLVRDSLKRLWAGFVVKDGNLITARWPGDAHKFALALKELLA